MNNPELLGGYYSVCKFCQEGKFNLLDGDINTEFEEQHVSHGAIEIIPAAKFLSENLGTSYIDVDRPNLEPISTSLGPVVKKDIIDAFKTAKTMRSKYFQQKAVKEEVCSSFFPHIIYADHSLLPINFEKQIFTKEDWLTPQLKK